MPYSELPESERDLQRRRNLETRDAWQRFAGHRDQVTRRLTAVSDLPAGRLAVLGAGNCNDLDLPKLRQVFTEVRLIDLDLESVESGVRRQERQQVNKGVSEAPCHIGPRLDLLGKAIRKRPGSDAAAPDLQLEVMPESLRGQFQVVGSVGLLSQLIDTWVRGAREGQDVSQAVRDIRQGHLLQILELLRPGGTGWLMLDFVSSETAPGLIDCPERELSAYATSLLAQGNHFLGINPFVVAQDFVQNKRLRQFSERLRHAGLWCWDLGPRTYAVWALRFQRRHRLSAR